MQVSPWPADSPAGPRPLPAPASRPWRWKPASGSPCSCSPEARPRLLRWSSPRSSSPAWPCPLAPRPAGRLGARQAIARIGPPGVRIGNGTFITQPIEDGPGWRHTGDLDDRPGDELALVGTDAVRLLASDTLEPIRELPLDGEARRWNWFSQLARGEAGLVVVETGGGFQETRVRTLDGTELWRYHPDASLPPSALRPADLDADGRTEFYVATGDALVRLDGGGREVWRTPAVLHGLLDTVPRGSGVPPWIVGASDGQTVTIWNDAGHVLGTVALDGGRAIGAIEWPAPRGVLVAGDDGLRVVGLEGRTAWSWAVADMTVTGAAVVRFDPGGPPYLAVTAAADRDTGRARLQIVTPDKRVVYDEVLASIPQLLTARTADGRIALFVNAGSLATLRRR